MKYLTLHFHWNIPHYKKFQDYVSRIIIFSLDSTFSIDFVIYLKTHVEISVILYFN